MDDGRIEFLCAKLAEEEARYRETVASLTGWAEDCADLNEGYILGEAHRMLAEVAAKQRIVAHVKYWAPTLRVTSDGWTEEAATAYRMALDWVLEQLASSYADYPESH